MTKNNESIRFLVDAPIPEKAAYALPSKESFLQMRELALDLPMEEVSAKVSSAVEKVQKVFSGLANLAGPFEVSEVTFSLSFDAGGEVSILSLAKGNLSASAGIEVKLVKSNGG